MYKCSTVCIALEIGLNEVISAACFPGEWVEFLVNACVEDEH